ncbi:hypothetical protein NP945_29200 [Mesorhizobium sp. LMG17149]|uniref:hypothetical protein n=1 Tax=Mesorhizobium sp. LMG17149 TaxID=2968497 RepID=UPI002117DFB4|nr:hypothetical protein [Mesorhizobium sp. LMG17149]MCQ8875921.1 hypothetical protein [Mesorhizobium sp. LMG17149]
MRTGKMMAAAVAWIAGAFPAGAQEQTPEPSQKSVRLVVNGQVSEDDNQQRLNARIVAAFSDVPVAIGVAAEKGNGVARLMVGGAANLGELLAVQVTGQFVREDADQLFGLTTDKSVETWSLASSLDLRLSAATTVSLGVDGWNSPSAMLIDEPFAKTRFDGASGVRVAPGFETYLDPSLRLGARIGYERAIDNGDDGLFAKVDFSKAFGKTSIEGTAWTSPNFGAGAQIGLGYAFDNDMTASVYAGYRDGMTQGAYLGAKLSMEFGPHASQESGGLINRLDRQMQYAEMTMPGVPKTARAAVSTEINSPFKTVFDVPCQSVEPTPGCTFFMANGNRITLADDPHYNRYGNGSDDLGYVRFDSVGNAAVYNNLGQYQYSSSASAFEGFVGGTTIGVGTTGFYWENVASGTYWLGKNGILYSANSGSSNFQQAIN